MTPHRLRQGIYRVMGAGFAPDPGGLAAVAAGSLDVLEGVGLYDYAFAPDVTDLLEAFAGADPVELHAAHVEVFEIGVAGDAIQPRESARLGNPHTGDVPRILAEIRRCYERLGVPIDDANPDLVDHAATELAAMATLCGEAARRADLGGSEDVTAVVHRQIELAEDHVLTWIPDVGDDLVRIDVHPAFTALGAATVAFLEHERQLLPMLLEPKGVTS